MILKGSQIPLGIGIQSLVQQLRNDTALIFRDLAAMSIMWFSLA